MHKRQLHSKQEFQGIGRCDWNGWNVDCSRDVIDWYRQTQSTVVTIVCHALALQRWLTTVALEVASHSNSTALTSAAYAPSLKLLPRVRRHSSGHRSNLVPRILRHSSIRVCRVCAVTPVATNSNFVPRMLRRSSGRPDMVARDLRSTTCSCHVEGIGMEAEELASTLRSLARGTDKHVLAKALEKLCPTPEQKEREKEGMVI